MFFFYQSLLNGNLKKALEQFHLTFFQQEGKKASNMTLQKIYWHQRQKKTKKKEKESTLFQCASFAIYHSSKDEKYFWKLSIPAKTKSEFRSSI